MSVPSFNQSYKKIINTFKGIDNYDEDGPENSTSFSDLFQKEQTNYLTKPPKKTHSPSKQKPVGILAQNKKLRQSLYASIGGIPHPKIINMIQQSVSKTTDGSLTNCFCLPSSNCVIGSDVVIKGVVPVKLRELFKRSAGAANITINEVNNTTTLSGGLSAFEKQHPTISFLKPKQHNKTECELSGLCVTDDDYVEYKNGKPVLPIRVTLPTESKNARNRSLEEILSYIRDINPNITGEVVEKESEPVFRLYHVTPEDMVHLDFTGKLTDRNKGSNQLDRYIMFDSNAKTIDPILALSKENLKDKIFWHRVRALVIMVTLFLIIVGVGIGLFYLCRTENIRPIVPETVPKAPAIHGGAVAPIDTVPDTLSVIIETLQDKIQQNI